MNVSSKNTKNNSLIYKNVKICWMNYKRISNALPLNWFKYPKIKKISLNALFIFSNKLISFIVGMYCYFISLPNYTKKGWIYFFLTSHIAAYLYKLYRLSRAEKQYHQKLKEIQSRLPKYKLQIEQVCQYWIFLSLSLSLSHTHTFISLLLSLLSLQYFTENFLSPIYVCW